MGRLTAEERLDMLRDWIAGEKEDANEARQLHGGDHHDRLVAEGRYFALKDIEDQIGSAKIVTWR